MICTPEDDKSHALDSRRLLEAPIYELVSDIGRESNLLHEEEMNKDRLLAQDTKFMTLLEGLHNNFEIGYTHLIELRKKS